MENSNLKMENHKFVQNMENNKFKLNDLETNLDSFKEISEQSEKLKKENEDLKNKLKNANKILEETHRNLDSLVKDNDSHVQTIENLHKEKFSVLETLGGQVKQNENLIEQNKLLKSQLTSFSKVEDKGNSRSCIISTFAKLICLPQPCLLSIYNMLPGVRVKEENDAN